MPVSVQGAASGTCGPNKAGCGRSGPVPGECAWTLRIQRPWSFGDVSSQPASRSRRSLLRVADSPPSPQPPSPAPPSPAPPSPAPVTPGGGTCTSAVLYNSNQQAVTSITGPVYAGADAQPVGTSFLYPNTLSSTALTITLVRNASIYPGQSWSTSDALWELYTNITTFKADIGVSAALMSAGFAHVQGTSKLVAWVR